MKKTILTVILITLFHFYSPINAQEKTISAYNPEAQLERLGITLPTPSTPLANYVQAVRTGNLLFLSGNGPSKKDGTYITGKVGADLTIEQGYAAARITGINQLAILKAELGI